MPLPVITVAQMREWEHATWAAGLQEDVVMRRAGRVVGRHAKRLTRPGDSVLVLAGKGHNGDDACYAAESLVHACRNVKTIRITEPESALASLNAAVGKPPALILDGLFGIGLNRPLSPPWLELIRRLNTIRAPIVAVDVPSGLDADTGLPQEETVRAAVTVTLGTVKHGLLATTAWPYVGRLLVESDIGLLPCPFSTALNWTVPDDFHGFPPARPAAGHKGTFGHLAILAGSLGYHGAAVLAARGAQRAQPGLITLLTAPEVYFPVAAQLQAVMVRPWSENLELPPTVTGVVVGPGLASPEIPETLQNAIRRLWLESPLAIVADASALSWLPTGPCPDGALRVLTPHPGEAARLLRRSNSEVQNNRFEAARELSRQFGGCHVVLKGHQTVVHNPPDSVFVNSSGNPFLGQGGSGDLLSGYLGGHLAQAALRETAELTIRYAVWQHGAAADALTTTQSNWTVEDLACRLGSIVS